jgi:hypothetical protein
MKNSLIKTDFTQERITFYLNSPDLAPPNYSEMSKKKKDFLKVIVSELELTRLRLDIEDSDFLQ